MIATLTPAYGRDYKSKRAVLADWNAGKDFVYNDVRSPWDGKYANKADLKGQTVRLRYDRLRKLIVVTA